MRGTGSRPVKSAQRVLELLEYFGANRRQVSVMEICRALGYPQSSTSELLRCLVNLGYLTYDGRERSFRPTPRVAILGAWVKPELFRQGHLLPMMDELSVSTTELIALATTVGVTVRYIHVIDATNPVRMHVPQGATRPLLISATGKLFLTQYDERKVKSLVHRLNAEEPDPERKVRYADLANELDQIRRQGYAVSYNKVNPGGGMIAMLLPSADRDQPLAVGIGGVSAILEANLDRYLAALRQAIARHCTFEESVEVLAWPVPAPKLPMNDPFFTQGYRV